MMIDQKDLVVPGTYFLTQIFVGETPILNRARIFSTRFFIGKTMITGLYTEFQFSMKSRFSKASSGFFEHISNMRWCPKLRCSPAAPLLVGETIGPLVGKNGALALARAPKTWKFNHRWCRPYKLWRNGNISLYGDKKNKRNPTTN